jgi:hypothetical protein
LTRRKKLRRGKKYHPELAGRNHSSVIGGPFCGASLFTPTVFSCKSPALNALRLEIWRKLRVLKNLEPNLLKIKRLSGALRGIYSGALRRCSMPNYRIPN